MTNKEHRILVVDDVPDWRSTFTGLLEDEGYTVQAVASRSEAIGLLVRNRFDLALLDMRLDETDEDNTEGLDLAAEIRRRWPGVRIIIITGYGTPARMKQAIEPGHQGQTLAEDYIPKNQTDDELLQILEKVLKQ